MANVCGEFSGLPRKGIHLLGSDKVDTPIFYSQMFSSLGVLACKVVAFIEATV